MSISINCAACGVSLRLSESLYEKKIHGRRVRMPCKACRAPIDVDARANVIRVSEPPPAPSPTDQTPAHDDALGDEPTRRMNEIPTRPGHEKPGLDDADSSRDPNAVWTGEGWMLPRQRSIPPTPPRPWELKGSTTQQADPFEDRSSELPPLSRPITLLPDGTLVNEADRPGQPAARRGNRVARWLPAACLLGGLVYVVSTSGLGVVFPQAQSAGAATTKQAALAVADATSASPRAAGAVQGPMEASKPDEPVPAPVAEDSGAELPARVNPGTVATPPAAVARPAEAEAPSTPVEAEVAQKGDEPTSAPTEPAEEPTEAGAEGAEGEAVEPGPFDKSAAVTALSVAEGQASVCRKAGDPSGTARVVVTFAPSGRVTSATVSGPPFAGTSTGGCIASRFRSARVPVFTGSHVTVSKTVVIH